MLIASKNRRKRACIIFRSLGGEPVELYKITKIVHALWLAERRVCMRVCKDACDIKMFWMFCFSRANHEKGFELKTSTSLLYWAISSSAETWKIFTKHGVSILSWADILSEKKPVFWKASFLQNKDWLRVQASCTRLRDRLVRICLLISALNKRVLLFFSGKLFYKSNRKLFTCVCISWYKHSRGWENSPNPSSVYIRICKHR